MLRYLLASAAALTVSLAAQAAELPIIAKARAYLGPEAALTGLQSVHYVGTVLTADPADPKKQTRASIEIIVQKPDQYRVTMTSDRTIETTALDGYDGWTRVTAANDPTKWQQTLLGSDQIKRLRANTWENTAYYRGLEREGGVVEDKGRATIDGVACQKVAFVHNRDIVFTRFFDVATGRLVYSETEAGGTIREEGEINAGGIRFPKSIITAAKNQAGQTQMVTINFEKITVNEKFPASFFRVPSLSTR